MGPRPALIALPTRDPPRGWGGPRVQDTLLGAEKTPSKGGPDLLGQREGGEVVVKPSTAGGSVSPSKSGPDYYLAVQYSWSIHRPGTRADKGGGPSQGLGVFLWRSAQQGWCPRPAIAGAFTVCA